MRPRPLLPITLAVVCAHGVGLWALQSAWRQPTDKLTPLNTAAVMTVRIQAPKALPRPQPVQVAAMALPNPMAIPEVPQPPTRPKPSAPVVKRQPHAEPAPKQTPASAPAPASASSSTMDTAASAATTTTSVPSTASDHHVDATGPAAASGASALPLKIELPSSTAAFLRNPPPTYPPLSLRLGEQGDVVVRALIEIDGTASEAHIETSSGYPRLDTTAVQTVLHQWRYKPGKKAGAPEPMWVSLPITFRLN